MKLHLNFKKESIRNNPFAFIFLFALIGSVHQLWFRNNLLETRDRIAEHIVRQQTKSTPLTYSQPHQRPNPKEISEIQKVSYYLQLPWETLFQQIKKAATKNIFINKLETGVEKKQIVIVGQADSSEAILDFVNRLRSQKVWQSVFLKDETKAHNISSQNFKPYNFQLELIWKP